MSTSEAPHTVSAKLPSRILHFTKINGVAVYIAPQKIDSVFEDTYSVAHGKATCIMTGTTRHYVTESVDYVVSLWDYVLQLIATGHA